VAYQSLEFSQKPNSHGREKKKKPITTGTRGGQPDKMETDKFQMRGGTNEGPDTLGFCWRNSRMHKSHTPGEMQRGTKDTSAAAGGTRRIESWQDLKGERKGTEKGTQEENRSERKAEMTARTTRARKIEQRSKVSGDDRKGEVCKPGLKS